MEKVMKEISIIINGVRYDATTPQDVDNGCDECDLGDFCTKVELHNYTCFALIGSDRCFKESYKKFEK